MEREGVVRRVRGREDVDWIERHRHTHAPTDKHVNQAQLVWRRKTEEAWSRLAINTRAYQAWNAREGTQHEKKSNQDLCRARTEKETYEAAIA